MTTTLDRPGAPVHEKIPGPLGARFCALMVLAAMVLPANLVVAGPLRSLGSAGRIFGLVALGIVLVVFVQRDLARATWGHRVSGSAAVPMVFVMYVIATVGLYGVSYQRVMSSAEAAGGTRTLFATLALAGVGLGVALFVSDLRGVRTVMGCVVVGIGFSAVIGILQSRLSLDLADLMRLPGLAVNREVSTGIRNNITRVLGSAGHPIEFTVILAVGVPVALHAATYASTKGRRQAAAFAAVAMLAGIPLGVSRTGILGIAIALICYAVVWTWRQRVTAMAIALVGLVFYRLVQPGVLGTIYGFFTGGADELSVVARTDDYPLIDRLLAGKELFGLGPGTFLPNVYFYLDNQWLLAYVEGGYIGVVVFAVVPLTGLVVAQMARWRATEPVLRDAAQALFAGIAALTACAATFDLFSFQQVTILMFVYIGLASAALVVASDSRRSVDVAEVPSEPGVGVSIR